jgi:hypothetical protein
MAEQAVIHMTYVFSIVLCFRFIIVICLKLNGQEVDYFSALNIIYITTFHLDTRLLNFCFVWKINPTLLATITLPKHFIGFVSYGISERSVPNVILQLTRFAEPAPVVRIAAYIHGVFGRSANR